MTGRLFAAAIGICLAVISASAENPAKTFLVQYCVDCHSGEDPSGERDFASLDLASADQDTAIALQEVIDQLTLGDMPPEDAEQPSATQRKEAIASLTASLAGLRQQMQTTGGQTVLRRLTRSEYLSTVSDLLNLNLSMFDPTIRFPRDNTVEHLENVGDTLVTSAYLLEQYLDAADAVIEKALAQLDRPEERTWHFEGRFRQQPELDPAHQAAFNYRYMCLYDSPLADRPEGAYGSLHDFHEGVPHDGIYRIRVRAQALHRDTPYDPAHLRMDLNEAFRLGIRPGNATVGSMHNVQPTQPLLAEKTIEDGELKWYEFEVPLDEGFSPRFTFENGLEAVRPLHTRLFRIYNDTLPEKVRKKRGIFECRKAILRYGQVPQIRIHEVEITGPIHPAWPPDRVAAVLPDGTFDATQVQEYVRSFASRAYRRPVREDEQQRLLSVYESRIEQGRDSFEAFKDTLKVVLCSPAFLYFQPDCPPDSDEISQHAAATRLAYFLTGTAPDRELRGIADRKGLDRKTRLAQTRRLLSDQRSDVFVERFLDAWLNLRDLGSMPPDRDAFWRYYASNLHGDMKHETQRFFRHLLDENLPADEWLSADYSFINRDLAKLYDCVDQVPPEGGNEFRKVTFKDGFRGGLFGQASVLTVSANGIETSPVIRGVWMLENVFGTPPPPPPDDVPDIDPDVRGAKSIRDRLEKHRTIAACNECHRKIDPLGFALETYDPIGGLRTRYENKQRIDTSGKLPSGQTFGDIIELKSLLMQRREFFIRAFTEKLLAYALGRRIEPVDRPIVDAILESVRDDGYRTRSLLEAVVASDAFTLR